MKSSGVAITGLGAVSPLGLTAKQMWKSLRQGICGIDKIKSFDASGFSCQVAGEAPEFDIRKYVPKTYRKATKLFSRDIKLSVVAANDAFCDSRLVTKGIEPDKVNVDPARMSINYGAGLISCDLTELGLAVAQSVNGGKFDIRKWGREAMESLTPLWLLKYLPNMPACHIGIIHDIQGPSNTITCAEVSSHLAIGESRELIIRGSSDVALAGGAEAKINPVILIRQCLLKRAAQNANDSPASSCRPFDAAAGGSVFGEAGGAVVLENIEHAKACNAKIYAELVGFGQSNNLDPSYIHLESDGKGVRIAIEAALANARISPGDIDLIIPHGTAIPRDDRVEAAVLQEVFADHLAEIAVWPTKSMLSNTGAACGSLDVIAAAFAISEGFIPPAKNCYNQAPGCKLNISATAVEKPIRYALCCGYTYGGQTAALVLKKPGGF